MSDDFSTLPRTLDAVWSRLEGAARDRRGPARYMALATRGLREGAEARMVILRRADRASSSLVVHTHALSHKIAELAAAPAATLLLWDAAHGFQARIKVHARAEPGSDADWARVPDAGRTMNYGTVPPAMPLPAPEAVEAARADRSAFTRIVARIDQIETLHLGPDLVRRARFSRSGDFEGQWIAP
jgi:pyridoxamine 5'-phosphate oxidase